MAKFKKKLERQRKNLPDVPEYPQTPEELAAYQDLLGQIRRAGNEKHTSIEILLVAATQRAHLEELNAKINALPSQTVNGSHGQVTLHPLVKERRQLQSSYLQTLGKLLLTTRSRAVSRLKDDQEGDDMSGGLDDENPILRAIS